MKPITEAEISSQSYHRASHCVVGPPHIREETVAF